MTENNGMNVEDWVELFTDIGITQDMMHSWHDLFESRHPEAHQSFLEWLGIPPDRIAEIRDANY